MDARETRLWARPAAHAGYKIPSLYDGLRAARRRVRRSRLLLGHGLIEAIGRVMADPTDLTLIQLQAIRRELAAALENAARDRELAGRAILRADASEAQMDALAADLHRVHADIAMIDMKLANLAVIQIDVADIKDRLTRIETVLEQIANRPANGP